MGPPQGQKGGLLRSVVHDTLLLGGLSVHQLFLLGNHAFSFFIIVVSPVTPAKVVLFTAQVPEVLQG